ncbi:MAG TPA: MFS transporter, partial [Stellaceae bacterium]|nr:MFS transporter [Stellaceae bacterium]
MAFEELRRPVSAAPTLPSPAIPGPGPGRDGLGRGRFDNISRAFAQRNYRIYAIGNGLSLIGWWLQRVAVGWLAWTLTHSGTWLGLVSLADFLPVLFLSPFAGVLADRRDRVWIIRITQLCGCAQASLLAILVATGWITVELLFTLVLLLGIASALAQPSRLALIPTLVDRASLPSALAINSVIFNLARFVGPAVAGVLIANVSIAAAFAANAVSYIAFQISLARLRDLPPRPVVERQNAISASIEAYAYASRHPGIGPMLLLFVVTTIGTRGFIELFPGFADSVFARGPQGLSMLTSTVGLGAICGGAWMVLRPAITGLAAVVLWHTLLMSLAILAFTATDRFYVALPCVFVAGAAMTITGTGAQTLIQAAVEPRLRGRVMALYGMIFRAGPALGTVLIGLLSARLGLRLALAGGAMVSCGFWLLTRLYHKPIAA